jgi:hypothetical protein
MIDLPKREITLITPFWARAGFLLSGVAPEQAAAIAFGRCTSLDYLPLKYIECVARNERETKLVPPQNINSPGRLQ